MKASVIMVCIVNPVWAFKSYREDCLQNTSGAPVNLLILFFVYLYLFNTVLNGFLHSATCIRRPGSKQLLQRERRFRITIGSPANHNVLNK